MLGGFFHSNIYLIGGTVIIRPFLGVVSYTNTDDDVSGHINLPHYDSFVHRLALLIYKLLDYNVGMERAIKKAIIGGYQNDIGDHEDEPRLLLDPKFWQALGKEQYWEDDKLMAYHTPRFDEGATPKAIRPAEWRHIMHKFLDHKIEGKDVDEFFNQLLK